VLIKFFLAALAPANATFGPAKKAQAAEFPK
jgi:hypothetical protein